jgi:hypothetical protein
MTSSTPTVTMVLFLLLVRAVVSRLRRYIGQLLRVHVNKLPREIAAVVRVQVNKLPREITAVVRVQVNILPRGSPLVRIQINMQG